MPVLKNARHERFAQLLAEGKAPSKAYEEAGDSPDSEAACRLSAKVSRRVSQLLAKAANKVVINLETLTEMFIEDRQAAHKHAQIAAAVSAGEKSGRLYGMFIERAEITGKNGAPLIASPLEEIEQRLQSLSERQKPPAEVIN